MLIFGNVVAITSMIIYTVATALQPSANWLSYVSVVGGVGIIFGFSIGPGPITLVILPEMLDQSARPTVMMTSGLTLWVGFTIVSVTTPYLFVSLFGFFLDQKKLLQSYSFTAASVIFY
uniref:Major facilitator superfamily (MFS) profile domain-containing protein n=1 Tax=Ciona savignyi TaxID=51511 RepID=H2Y4J8_CIOSA